MDESKTAGPFVLILISAEQYDAMIKALTNIQDANYPDSKKRSHASAIKTCLQRNHSHGGDK